jgi:hypothetical protein
VSDYRGNCQGCFRRVFGMWGIYCANAWSKRGHFLPCEGIWYGTCFLASDEIVFPIRLPVDEEGFRVVRSKDVGRFVAARNGDHLMSEFQCPLCHFRNIYKRSPREESATDCLVMNSYIPRVILDAFWSRESSTVCSNRNEFERLLKSHVKFGMQAAMPALGPKSLADLAYQLSGSVARSGQE